VSGVRTVPFNRPHATGGELANIAAAIEGGHLSGSGPFTDRAERWLESRTGCARAFLTHSGSAALEEAALLLGLGPGDEVIMPSFSFATTAGAVALRGAVPVFVDIRPDTLNIDEALIEAAITERTRAVVVVHYAGVACAMDRVCEVAERYGLVVVEDAAHALGAAWRERPLGGIGQIGTLSFHETKNVICGEGGALLLRDAELVRHAEAIHEKGTTRSAFLRGEIDRYRWAEIGGAGPMSEINAAFLSAQLDSSDVITARRLGIWQEYFDAFGDLEERGLAERPVVPTECRHNGHLFRLMLADEEGRNALITGLDRRGVNAVFHYVPLHSSPAGSRWGRADGPLPVTDRASARLVRLPLWPGMADADVEHVIEAVHEVLLRHIVAASR